MKHDFSFRTKLPSCGLCGLPIRNNLEVRINEKPYHPNHVPKEKHGSNKQIARQGQR